MKSSSGVVAKFFANCGPSIGPLEDGDGPTVKSSITKKLTDIGMIRKARKE
jgi:hypothetical protein